jgi:hypothetical protein
VQQRRLAGIVQTEKQELGVLIEETQRGQDIVDYRTRREISKLHLVPRDAHIDHKQPVPRHSRRMTRCRGWNEDMLGSNAAKLSREIPRSFFLGVWERPRTVTAGDRMWCRENTYTS